MRATRDKRELTSRNQQMLAMRRAGSMLREIAATFQVSEVRVHVIIEREAKRQRREMPHSLSTALS